LQINLKKVKKIFRIFSDFFLEKEFLEKEFLEKKI
jgi:hypothetical protein